MDCDRVGLSGLSFGSEIVHHALFTMEHLRTAISSGLGMSPSFYYLGGAHTRSFLKEWGVDAPGESTDAVWRERSLSMNVEKVKSSFLINAADTEYLLALQTVTALQDAGKAVEMYVMPEEGHIKVQPQHLLAIYRRNLDWARFWLQDYEDPVPQKVEQYRRWVSLRSGMTQPTNH